MFSPDKKLELVICDFDGLLGNSEEPYLQALKAAAAELQCDIDTELLHSLRGRSMSDSDQILSESLGSSFPIEEIRSRADQLFDLQLPESGVEWMPGVGDLLDVLSEHETQLQRAIASSADRDWVVKCAGSLKKFFSIIKTRDDVEQAKPAPDLFLSAAKTAKVDPENCLVLEDAEKGVEAAFAAGMSVIQVGPEPSGNYKHKVLPSLKQVADFIKSCIY